MLLVVMIIALTLSSEEYLVTDKISVIAQRPPPPDWKREIIYVALRF